MERAKNWTVTIPTLYSGNGRTRGPGAMTPTQFARGACTRFWIKMWISRTPSDRSFFFFLFLPASSPRTKFSFHVIPVNRDGSDVCARISYYTIASCNNIMSLFFSPVVWSNVQTDVSNVCLLPIYLFFYFVLWKKLHKYFRAPPPPPTLYRYIYGECRFKVQWLVNFLHFITSSVTVRYVYIIIILYTEAWNKKYKYAYCVRTIER